MSIKEGMTDKAKDAFAAYLAILATAGELTEEQALRICGIIKEGGNKNEETCNRDTNILRRGGV